MPLKSNWIQEAQVNVMLIGIYKSRERDPQDLKPTNAILTTFWGNKIDVLGRCKLKCRYKNLVCVLDCYVVNACAHAALSFKTCQKLSLIKVVTHENENELWGC